MFEEEENQDEAQKKFLRDDTNVVSESIPTEKIDVEEEAKKIEQEVGYDPAKLAGVLIVLGTRMLGVHLYEYQLAPAYRIIYSVLARDGAEITMLFSRQSGKTEVISFVVTVLAVFLPVLAKAFKELAHFANGCKMGAFAPQLDQVETLYGRCLERIWSDNTKQFLTDPDIADYPLSVAHFKLKSGSSLKAQSGAKQSKIESKTYHIVFIDESQDMETEKVRKSIMPMLASSFGTCVRLGTPNRNKGDFYETIKKAKIHDEKLKKSELKTKQRHFEYNWETIVKMRRDQFKKDGLEYHLLYEKSVYRDMESMGKHSESFRMSYALEWLLDVGMFITEQAIEERMWNKRITFPSYNKKQGDFVVAGLDIASARASTVLTQAILDAPVADIDERPKKTICGWTELANLDYDQQFEIISERLRELDTKVLFADYTGVGRVFVDRLVYHFANKMVIVPYMFTPQSKSDMWKRLDEDTMANRIIVPAHPTMQKLPEFQNFNDQMTNLTKSWKGGYMICAKISGKKDDYCDSLGLMNLAGNYFYTPQQPVEISDENFIFDNGRKGDSVRDSRW